MLFRVFIAALLIAIVDDTVSVALVHYKFPETKTDAGVRDFIRRCNRAGYPRIAMWANENLFDALNGIGIKIIK